ncbi:hypothetical protein RB200_08470 [Streptomyces sp. PmtG]
MRARRAGTACRSFSRAASPGSISSTACRSSRRSASSSSARPPGPSPPGSPDGASPDGGEAPEPARAARRGHPAQPVHRDPVVVVLAVVAVAVGSVRPVLHRVVPSVVLVVPAALCVLFVLCALFVLVGPVAPVVRAAHAGASMATRRAAMPREP